MSTEWKLAAIIAHHGVKGKEIAQEVGVSENAITQWKREAPPLSRWDAIAAAITKYSRRCGMVRGVDFVENKESFAEKDKP
jgi:uncharacterized protein YjcR